MRIVFSRHSTLGAVSDPAKAMPVSGGFNCGGKIPFFSGMTVVALITSLFATPSFAEPTELDKKTVASKAYVDTKQDIIPTDKVLLYDEENDADDVYVPAIVVTNAEGTALNGDSVGIMDSDNVDFYNDNIDLDSFVPTVGAVGNEFNGVWDELDTKQYIIPGGTAGKVVTYTGNEGEVGSATVSSAALYLGTTLTNGDNIANITAVETKQDKFTCAGYEPGHENESDYCWLYNVNYTGNSNTPQTQCGLYGTTANSASQCCSGVLQVLTNKCGCNTASDCIYSEGSPRPTCVSASHICS